jgi:hypothetical protein
MSSFNSTANVTRVLLLFSGAALILVGIFGISLDLIHNWRIEEYSSFIALAIGSAILLATSIVYVVIPGYQSRQRAESLKEYYMRNPKGEIKNINHAIMERSQGLIGSTEMLAELAHSCNKEDVTLDECKNNIRSARKMLEQINYESAKLNELINDLEGNVSYKKD